MYYIKQGDKYYTRSGEWTYQKGIAWAFRYFDRARSFMNVKGLSGTAVIEC